MAHCVLKSKRKVYFTNKFFFFGKSGKINFYSKGEEMGHPTFLQENSTMEYNTIKFANILKKSVTKSFYTQAHLGLIKLSRQNQF